MNKKIKIPIMAFVLLLIIWVALAENCETCNTSALSGEADYFDEGLQMYSKVFFKGTNTTEYGILVISCDFPNNSNSYNVETVVHASTYAGNEIDLTPFKLKIWDSQGSGTNPGKPTYINPNNELGMGQLTRSFSLMIHTDYSEGTCIFKAEIWDEEEVNMFADLLLVWEYGEGAKKRADQDLIGDESVTVINIFGDTTAGQVVLIGLFSVICAIFMAFWLNKKATRLG